MTTYCSRLLLVFLAVCLAGTATAQDLRCEKYQLDNGLTVILHEDHALPTVAVNVLYRVGARDDPPQASSLAHLFEHLMFMGTERVPNGQFDALMEAGGGSNNASTSADVTDYFSSGPASLLPTLLWLEADRIEDLGFMMDEDKLDRQREVVRNEWRQNIENQPYGRAEVELRERLYPAGHPYHEAFVHADDLLAAATVPDLKSFFASYYVPNNASLCIAGDFDAAQVKLLVASLLGSLPRGSVPPRKAVETPKLAGVQRMTLLDKVQLPMIAVAYHSPARFAPGDAEMDLAAALLSEGKSSRLYKRLVYEEQIAVEVSAEQESSQLDSVFHISVMAKPDADLDHVEALVNEELDKLRAAAPDPNELERHKARFELDMLSRLEGLNSQAEQLNEYEFYFGEPNSFRRDLERYQHVTADGVWQWAKTVLTPDARVIVRVLPEEPERPASARDERPADLPPRPFTPPAPETFQLSNGMPVMLWHKSDLPLVAVKLLFHPGGPLDDVERAGLTSLMTTMLDEGAGDLDALEFTDALQALGATFGAGADHESIDVSLTVLKRNFDRAVRLLADAVRRPLLSATDLERVQRLHLDQLQQEEDEPVVVAGRAAARALFGAANPYGWPVEGTPESVAKLTLADVRRAHERFVQPDWATVLVAGDLSAAEAKAALERAFGNWQRTSRPARAPAAPPLPPRDKLSVVLVDRPEAVQTVVFFVTTGPQLSDPLRMQYRLLDTLLGGSFTSRLMQNLREEHGYTYGAHASFIMEPSAGYFTASASVQTDVTGPAITELLKELRRTHTGDISADEAAKARATVRTNVIDTFGGLDGVLDVAAERVAAGLPYETLAEDFEGLAKVTADDLNRLAKRFAVEQGILVLVGDAASIQEQLKPLGLPPPIELTPSGETADGAME